MFLFVLTVGAGIAYWVVYHSPVEEYIVDEKIEVFTPKERADFVEKPIEAAQVPDPVYPEQEIKVEVPIVSHPVVKPSTRGTLTRVHTPQGLYYIVVGSFIDGDLATDYAKQLMKQGTNITIIEPEAGRYFYRVAIEKQQGFQEATRQLKALKATHGPQIWIFKY